MTYELTYVLRSPVSPLKAPHVQCRLCPAQVATAGGDLAAGFMGVDVIRMPFKNIPTLILLLNFCTYIILVFKFIKGILFLIYLDGETRGKNNAL